jgi:hypothetical protein
MDASKYFWSGLSDAKFDAESESEVGFVLRAQGVKPQTDVWMKISKNVPLSERLWMSITFSQIVQCNLISNSRKIAFSK